jgi:sugar lactone lactonase YvrE
VLAAGLHFGEGPRWHDDRLWFSDFYDHAVKAVDLDGRIETRLVLDGQPSGLGWLPDGRLLVVSMLDRRVLRLEADALVVHADLDGVATFHCNDMVVDGLGRAYVGNFGFDLDGETESRGFRAVLEEHTTADVALVQPDGHVQVAATGLEFPNGSVVTPDGRTLIVAETLGRRLTAFAIGVDGTLAARRTWADLGRCLPDGICLDETGAVWVADASSPRCLRVAEGGEVLDEVGTGQPCYACALGGPDGRTLFMLTAESSAPHRAAAERTGRVMITEAAAPRAGWP